ncbi:hypothetical protein, partial [Oceaniglobus roseus]|uniref:hypothetical protein n=1 Tax=Oceaniglobus roseus TaxID=1737570 RepID=UPI000C7EA035
DWADRAAEAGRAVLARPGGDWRCGGTWFAGVNALDNDAAGRLPDGPPLPGFLQGVARDLAGEGVIWDRAQLSVCRPGYPLPSEGESAAAARYRRDRDAAHVDGLLPVGPERRRMLREPHAFVLGLPLNRCGAGASPMVVWEGSHRIMAETLGPVLNAAHPREWDNVDLTDAYHAARRRCFETCARVVVAAKPGGGYLVHRLALHGVAPWEEGAEAPEEGRMIAYFRPYLVDPALWPVPD